MERDYAERRGDILRDLDGLRVEVDPEKKILICFEFDLNFSKSS